MPGGILEKGRRRVRSAGIGAQRAPEVAPASWWLAGLVEGVVEVLVGIEGLWIQGGKLVVYLAQPLADALFVAAVAGWVAAA